MIAIYFDSDTKSFSLIEDTLFFAKLRLMNDKQARQWAKQTGVDPSIGTEEINKKYKEMAALARVAGATNKEINRAKDSTLAAENVVKREVATEAKHQDIGQQKAALNIAKHDKKPEVSMQEQKAIADKVQASAPKQDRDVEVAARTTVKAGQKIQQHKRDAEKKANMRIKSPKQLAEAANKTKGPKAPQPNRAKQAKHSAQQTGAAIQVEANKKVHESMKNGASFQEAVDNLDAKKIRQTVQANKTKVDPNGRNNLSGEHTVHADRGISESRQKKNREAERKAVSRIQSPKTVVDANKLSTGAKIGIGIGAAALTAGAGYGAYKLYQKKKAKERAAAQRAKA